MTSLHPTLIVFLLGVAFFTISINAQIPWRPGNKPPLPPGYDDDVSYDDESDEELDPGFAGGRPRGRPSPYDDLDPGFAGQVPIGRPRPHEIKKSARYHKRIRV